MFENASTLRSHYLSLVTILFAGAYNHRTHAGDHSVESAWLVVKLCPTLSWFLHPRSVGDAVAAVLRTSLCYPLYRSWRLSVRCLRDVGELLVLGRQAVTKMVLDVLDLLRHHEDAWRLGKVWIEDYASWLQSGARDDLLTSLGMDLLNMLERADTEIEIEIETETDGDGGDVDYDRNGGFPSKRSFHIGNWNLETLEKIALDCSDSEVVDAEGGLVGGVGNDHNNDHDDDDHDTDTIDTDTTTTTTTDSEDDDSEDDDDSDSDSDSDSRTTSDASTDSQHRTHTDLLLSGTPAAISGANSLLLFDMVNGTPSSHDNVSVVAGAGATAAAPTTTTTTTAADEPTKSRKNNKPLIQMLD